MPTPFVAANWKMNTTVEEGVALVNAMKGPLSAIKGVQVVVCPPFVSLAAVREALRGSGIGLGAQNVHHEEAGAYTGEVAPRMLQGLCDYVIVGHSERRHLFDESDETVNKKLNAVVNASLKPILCVGERLEERESGRAEEVVVRQLTAALEGCERPEGLAVAYEPVWAIGTGRAATAEIANAIMGLIRATLKERYGAERGGEVPLLYGGSVTSENVGQFAGEEHIDGALVGGASLRADEFVAIVRGTAESKGVG